MRWNFNLSRNSSLRTLETTAISITDAGDTASGFLRAVLSTVTSPFLLDLLITYSGFVVYCHMPRNSRARHVLPSQRAAEALNHRVRFKVYSEMYAVREFRLVICADVLGDAIEDTVRALECILEKERKNGGLDYLPCEPSIFTEMRSLRTRPMDSLIGGCRPVIGTCAL